jgi:hypothetical protein
MELEQASAFAASLQVEPTLSNWPMERSLAVPNPSSQPLSRIETAFAGR